MVPLSSVKGTKKIKISYAIVTTLPSSKQDLGTEHDLSESTSGETRD
jgi:hypothetical protein